MTKNSLLDACVILAYLRKEPGWVIVEQLLQDPAEICYMHSINLCKDYHQEIRTSGEPIAKQVVADLLAVGVIVRQDMDDAFWMRVGELKSRGGIALPDCFALALAEHLGAQVVTSDHKEFDPIVPLGIYPI